MKILFLGSLYPQATLEKLVKAKVDVGFAAHVFQTALIQGLDHFADIQIVSELSVPSYPKFKEVWVHKEKFSHNSAPNLLDTTVSYLNLPIVKQISICLSYIKTIRKCNRPDIVLIYEITSRHLLSAICGCRRNKKVLIVPDLPEFMSENKSFLYKLFKKIDRWIINWAIKRIDGFILLSEPMKESLSIIDKPYITVEGIYNLNLADCSVPKSTKKVLLYTGKIEKWFGLYDLLAAFTKIEGDNYELWLCGTGDIDMVIEFSNIDERIKYLGVLPHDEVLKLQKQATILVNPRHSHDIFTMYSFPSKTMEYMASGTPTLMSRLKSLPPEYYEHLYFFDDESIEGMSRSIQHCLDIPVSELNRKGMLASLFIRTFKNSLVQGEKIMNFISDIIL